MKRLILGFVIGVVIATGATVYSQTLMGIGVQYSWFLLEATSFGSNHPDTFGTITQGNVVQAMLCNDKLAFKFNDGGTNRYFYLNLSGESGTWTHTTSSPC